MSIILDGLEFELANFVGSDGLGHVSTQPATTGASGASYPAEPLFPERVFRAALNQLGQGLFSTSTTSLAIGTGSKAFTLATSVQITDGAFILATDTANDANYMYGQVTSVVGLVYTVNVIATGGSGTISSWNFQVSGVQGVAGTVADGDKGDIVVSGGGGTWTLEDGAVTEAKMTLADNTTHNATTSAHGFLKKLSNVAGEFMNGVGNWAVPASGGFGYASGRTYGPSNYVQTLTGQVLVANRLYAVPFLLTEETTFDRICAYCVSENDVGYRFGVYEDSNGAPGALLFDAGTATASTSNEYIDVTISETIPAGFYWLAMAASAGVGTVTVYAAAGNNTWVPPYMGTRSGIGAPYLIPVGYYKAHTYGALPDPFGTPTINLTSSGQDQPWIGLRKA